MTLGSAKLESYHFRVFVNSLSWSIHIFKMSVSQNGDAFPNVTTNASVEEVYFRPIGGCQLYSFIIYTGVVGLLCILGTVGNLTAFAVFWKDNIKTSTSFLFQGLSFIDTIMLVCVFPIYVIKPFVDYTQMMTGYRYVEPFVLVYGLPLAFMAQTATIWVTVLVGVNRYVSVCKPYQAPRLCTVAQAKKQLAIVLLFAILYNVPKFFESKLAWGVDERTNTTFVRPSHTDLGMNRLFLIIYGNIFYLVFLLILPLLILTVLNIRLIDALKALKRKRAEMQSRQQQQDNNVTFVLIIVVLVFTICQAPALVNQILWNVLDDDARICGGFQFFYSRISNTLVIVNSSVNFLIYFLFNTRFRQVLVQNVCKREYKAIRATTTATLTTTVKDDKEDTNETLLWKTE